MPIFLETTRLIINPPAMEELENSYMLQSDVDVMEYLGDGVRSKEEVKAWLQKAVRHQEKYGFSIGSIYEKTSGLFVGRAGLAHLDYDDTQPLEVAYLLTKNSWGKGYATELGQAIIQWAFGNLTFSKLIAHTNSKNVRSRRVLEKIGMRYVKMTREGDQEVVFYEIQNIAGHIQHTGKE